ncbi:MAG: hypothetical protein II625_02150 [Bacilli bacterium]|nr:hypothetical protein [Bacilli bacterium]
MFGYTFKQLPAKYLFGGYSVRKSYTVMTRVEDGKVIYDTFLLTYMDNYLSFYILMDNGKYKNVSLNIEVPEVQAEELMSKHIARGKMVDFDEEYDKEEIIGVFGPINIVDVMKKVDEMKKADENSDISLQAMLDVKSQYMGAEASGIIESYNRRLKFPKGLITVPPIKGSMDDDYPSVIGDELDFYDFMSNKTSEEIVKELKLLADNIDGVGNVREGKQVNITKGDENTAGTLEILDNSEENTRGTLDMGNVTDVK